jgi:hypothetical protein
MSTRRTGWTKHWVRGSILGLACVGASSISGCGDSAKGVDFRAAGLVREVPWNAKCAPLLFQTKDGEFLLCEQRNEGLSWRKGDLAVARRFSDLRPKTLVFESREQLVQYLEQFPDLSVSPGTPEDAGASDGELRVVETQLLDTAFKPWITRLPK